MTQTIAARKVKLHDLKTRFGLQQVQEETFFPEWLNNLPGLAAAEQQALDRIKRNYLYLLEYPVMENIVKMVVLSPLLDLAGFYESPFRVEGETNMLAAPNSAKPAFGLVLNGSEFLFLKLVRGEVPQYAMSDLFSLFNRGAINPQEMIVPIAVMAPTGICPDGWQQDRIQPPAWWEEPVVIALQKASIEPVSPPTNEYADLGPLFSFAEAPDTASQQTEPPDWIPNLFKSPAYKAQKQLLGSTHVADEVVAQILTALVSQRNSVTVSTVASTLKTASANVYNLLPPLQRILNIDGYLVMTYDETSDRISLDLSLLSQQFEIKIH